MMTFPTPLELLQNLIRFDSSNPPGQEAECMAYLDGLLREAGYEPTLLEKFPGRPNLVVRRKGAGNAPPLLLYGHVDVVPVAGQDWTHPPFAGEIADGFIWGRGTLDMKGGVAMLVSAFVQADAAALPGDLILCLVSDEERGGVAGARFLVEEHAGLFQGVRYALGEFGGFSLSLGGKRFYMIQVAEKQALWLRATVRGPGGHAATPLRGVATAKLAQLLAALDEHRFPVHITPAAQVMIERIAANLDAPMDSLLRGLLDPTQTDMLLEAMGDIGVTMNPLLRNTATPTVIRSGEAVNVIPAAITVDLDTRLVPGCSPEDGLRELRAIIGDDVEIETLWFDPGPGEPDMGLFDTLAGVLREADPEGIPVPLMLAGVTDARFFSQLGIQTYGFLPMRLPDEFNFTSTIHAADERIPVEAVDFGTQAILKVLSRFHSPS
jgi:acetylornithine deacetylase/succinyl-diaminopimelate desuccinylase-like protein